MNRTQHLQTKSSEEVLFADASAYINMILRHPKRCRTELIKSSINQYQFNPNGLISSKLDSIGISFKQLEPASSDTSNSLQGLTLKVQGRRGQLYKQTFYVYLMSNSTKITACRGTIVDPRSGLAMEQKYCRLIHGQDYDPMSGLCST
ncbi:hypothetical protein [Pseudobacteriovorax antillogorgiicola]|nr:hypothetical protein [Pseudobacteriovorax antillogorgiicola]